MHSLDALDLIQQRLDQTTEPEHRERLLSIAGNIEKGWAIRGSQLENLIAQSAPQGSMQSWRECLYSVIASGTAVTAAAKTALVPDFTLPANYLYPGRTLKYTLYGAMSSPITTPGTFTFTLNWGGAAGVVLASTAAIAPDPTAASTNVAWSFECLVVCRSVGSSGTAWSQGRFSHNDIQATAAALNMLTFPDVPAAVTIDTTTAKAITPAVTPSLTTGSVTAHIAVLEAIT